MSEALSLNLLDCTTAAETIRAGTITSEELTRACLARIAERDGIIKAWAHIDADHALAQARAADSERATGRGTGALHGVPIAIKDIIDTSDLPTENGCSIFSGRRPSTDAACVAALRNEGAIIIGKTVTTELALMTPSKTTNPADTDRTPGGSSAGSAASVADAMVPAAIGSQTAGSVLRPASYCGVYGFKPTFGLISRRGVIMQSHTLDTLGVFARSLDDIALVTDAISAHDPADDVSYLRSQGNLLETSRQAPPTEPLLAFVKTPVWDEMAEPSMKEAFAELVEELGDQCEEIEIAVLNKAIEWHGIVQLAENAGYYGPLQDRARDKLSDGLNARLDDGARIPIRAYLDGIVSRDPAYTAVASVFDRYAAILTPAGTGVAPPLSNGITGLPIFNGLWTYLGMPAISIPLLEIEGLPVGVQLTGPRRDDARLLRTARWLIGRLATQDNA